MSDENRVQKTSRSMKLLSMEFMPAAFCVGMCYFLCQLSGIPARAIDFVVALLFIFVLMALVIPRSDFSMREDYFVEKRMGGK